MTKTDIPTQIVRVKDENQKIPQFNRFYIPQTLVSSREPEDLLRLASCDLVDVEVLFMHQAEAVPLDYFARFQLIAFDNLAMKESQIRDAFRSAGLRPATLSETLAYSMHHMKALKEDLSIVGLGSSNIRSLRAAYFKKSLLYRLFVSQDGHDRRVRELESFPLVKWEAGTCSLHTTKSQSDLKSGRAYLGVVMDRKFDRCLFDKIISIADYLALPKTGDLPKDYLISLDVGFLFKGSDGTIYEIANWDQLDDRQVGAALLSMKDRGLRCYRPVFVEQAACA